MLHLDHTTETPLYLQLYRRIKQDILSGALPEGSRLSSTRALAKDLQAGRNTVENAYAQLTLEGYVTAKPGSGFVVNAMQNDLFPGAVGAGCGITALTAPAGGRTPSCRYDFHYGNLEPAAFPVKSWQKLSSAILAEACLSDAEHPGVHAYGDPRGVMELRAELAAYLYRSRGVNCSPDQIVICGGLQPTLTTLVRLLPNIAAGAAMEDPGYTGARIVFECNGIPIFPIPVKEDGIDLAALEASPARAVIVTPSHQFPTGAVMPIQKRMELLQWAANGRNVIIEDDYDSEFRYNGRPVPSLQSIDRHGRTVYLGTFSKALSPGLRIGYMVLPEWLLQSFMAIYGKYKNPVSLLEQRTLARFMAEGHWEKHCRKMCNAAKKKHDLLLASVAAHFKDAARIHGHNAGLHILLEFQGNEREEPLIQKAAGRGVRVYPASQFWLGKKPSGCTLLLGYGMIARDAIPEGIARLHKAWAGG